MILIRRILIEKRIPIAIVAGAIGLDVALYVFAIYPWTIKVTNADQRAESAERALVSIQQNYVAALKTTETKEKADAKLHDFYVNILPRDHAAARSITLQRLSELSADADLMLDRRTSVSQNGDGTALTTLRTTMLLTGEYQNIRDFIYSLETAREFIIIEQVSLSKKTEGALLLTLTLEISTYYWTGEGAT
jgi:Tfp pilus assembly protein PilO